MSTQRYTPEFKEEAVRQIVVGEPAGERSNHHAVGHVR